MLNFRAGLSKNAEGSLTLESAEAQRYLETARKLAEASSDPKDADLLPGSEGTDLLNESGFGPMGFPSFGAGPAGFPLPPGLDQFFDFFDDEIRRRR